MAGPTVQRVHRFGVDTALAVKVLRKLADSLEAGDAVALRCSETAIMASGEFESGTMSVDYAFVSGERR